MLNPNVVIPYDGTNASIPTGFDRETVLDNKFPKGWGTEVAGTAGGSATHTHTTQTHQHQPAHHTHAFTSNITKANADGARSGDRNTGDNHYHDGVSSTTTLESQTNSTPTWGSSSSNPPYYEVIYIKANSYQLIPKNGIVFRKETSRSNLTVHTPSLGKYLKGASTGANAGGTGGSFEHTHDISHSHVAAHSHSGTSNASNQKIGTEGDQDAVSSGHTHTIGLNGTNTTLNTNSPATYTSKGASGENIEPEFRTLNAFYSLLYSTAPLKGDICMWLGSPNDIPLGWKLCDGTNDTVDMRDKFVKVKATPGTSTTGGSNTHAHPPKSHSHTFTSATHIHGGGLGGSQTKLGASVHNDGYRMYPGHGHAGFAYVQPRTVSYGAATMTPNASSSQPEYVTVVFIEFIYSTVGGSFLVNLL